MATRNRLTPYQIVTAGDMSLASITSKPTNILNIDTVAFQMNCAGSPTGTFSAQVSLDYEEDANHNVINAGHWITLTLSSAPAPSGSAVNFYLELQQVGAPWIRLVYTKGSGTGTLNAFIAGKMLG